MPLLHKILAGVFLIVALSFGFAHHLAPDFPLQFERLHVFLFNLVTGGALILYVTRGREKRDWQIGAWVLFAVAYALSAFYEKYLLTIALTVPLSLLIENARVRSFSWFPVDFFRVVPVWKKFRHASVLCLSIGLWVAVVAILNSHFYHWVEMEKLSLDVFFLGYSFPISLITLSLIFERLDETEARPLQEAAFWSINLGVIVFFGFIIFELGGLELAISNYLLLSVLTVLGLFAKRAHFTQQKAFLLSGLGFLVITAITGVLYIGGYYNEALKQSGDAMIRLHEVVSLYGWNLSGLFIILREDGFPARFNTWAIIALQWLTVLILAPLGSISPALALISVLTYSVLVGFVVFSPTLQRRAAPALAAS
ncbi:MAG: hypothetical protein JXX28_10565 [Deltaproteobacteria bacterium]|nr:hypothetical protein [Deltaproteobacteria bacterium]